MLGSLIIRADSNLEIGTGHVMRCLALAQQCQDHDADVMFVLSECPDPLKERLQHEGMGVAQITATAGSEDDARQTAREADRRGAKWVIVDGYHFDGAYQCVLKESGFRVLCIDDYGHAEAYGANLILNQNVYAEESMYEGRAPQARLLLGTRYALLRREFRRWQDWRREIPDVARNVLITLGGADPANVTSLAIEALDRLSVEGLEAVVLVGGANPHDDALAEAVNNVAVDVQLKRDARDMPALMAWADVAISGGGSTCWELAFMGLPNLVFVLADNQSPIAEGLDDREVAVNLGWHSTVTGDRLAHALENLILDSFRRSLMSRRGRELVDGRGSGRVLDMMSACEV